MEKGRKWNFIGESSDDEMMISLFLLALEFYLFPAQRESPESEEKGKRENKRGTMEKSFVEEKAWKGFSSYRLIIYVPVSSI